MKFTSEQILKQGVEAQREGKVEKAEFLYRKILKNEPKHSNANHNLGILLISRNKLAEALPLFKTATEVNSNIEQFWVSYINALIKNNQNGDAEKILRNIISRNKNFIILRFKLAFILQLIGKFNEAEIIYKKVLELKPDFIDAYSNLGVILQKLDRLEEAEQCYRKAILLKPDYTEAHNNLGVVLQKLDRLKEAEQCYRKAIILKPDYAEAHSNLGNLLYKYKRYDEAEISYDKALEIKPNSVPALLGKGQTSFEKGNFELSLKNFDMCNNKRSKARSLSSLYALGRIEDIYERMNSLAEIDDENIEVAAFASFIAYKEKKSTSHKFCNNPIDFIHYSNLKSHLEDPGLFISDIIEELQSIKTMWEPSGKSTIKGYQSTSQLFKNSSEISESSLEKLQNLKKIIFDEIDSYEMKFKKEICTFMKKWPSKKNLAMWHVILKQQGYQNAHIHPSGWLSGVIYLKVVPHLERNEGAIELSLNGEHYSDVRSPKIVHQPKEGDIILFPSSLHHRTIPFSTNTDRIIVSFDLKPDKKN